MKIASAEVVKAPIIKKDDNGDETCQGTFPHGVRLTLDCGTTVYYSIKHRSFKTTLPRVQLYQFGRLATDQLGNPLLSKPNITKSTLEKLAKDHSLGFAKMIIGGIRDALENME